MPDSQLLSYRVSMLRENLAAETSLPPAQCQAVLALIDPEYIQTLERLSKDAWVSAATTAHVGEALYKELSPEQYMAFWRKMVQRMTGLPRFDAVATTLIRKFTTPRMMAKAIPQGVNLVTRNQGVFTVESFDNHAILTIAGVPAVSRTHCVIVSQEAAYGGVVGLVQPHGISVTADLSDAESGIVRHKIC